MRTVRDFKNFVLKESGVEHGFEFNRFSDAHLRFWRKLNDLGARNMDTHPPEKVPDIDATVQLSEEEWQQLEQEFRALPR